MKVGIPCDDWKIPTVRAAIEEAGFVIAEELPGPFAGVVTLILTTDEPARLYAVVQDANRAAPDATRRRRTEPPPRTRTARTSAP